MKTGHEFRRLPQPRNLDGHERDVLSALVHLAGESRRAVQCQASQAMVTEECESCPTIMLSVADAGQCPKVEEDLPLEARGVDGAGNDARVQLFVREGRIDELEGFRTDGEPLLDWPQLGP